MKDFRFVDKIEYKRNPIVFAYKKGYRFKDGYIINANGDKISIWIERGYPMFSIKSYLGARSIIVFKYFAFQNLGEIILNTIKVKPIDGDFYNYKKSNIYIGALKYDQYSIIKNRYQAVLNLGYYVDSVGNLKYRGFDYSHLPYVDDKGYKVFNYTNAYKKSVKIKVHRLQAFQKFGYDLFQNYLVRHVDGNKLNNSYLNIDIGDCIDNYKDKSRFEKLKYSIIKSGLKVSERNNLRNDYKNGVSVKELCEIYNLKKGTVWEIIYKKTQYEKYLETKNKM